MTYISESLLRWSEAGEWTVPVIGLSVNDLHRKLPGIVGERYNAVVIDTPPMKERLGVVASAIRLATHVLVPMAPTGIEYGGARARLADPSTNPHNHDHEKITDTRRVVYQIPGHAWHAHCHASTTQR